jgi:hypothetical protein
MTFRFEVIRVMLSQCVGTVVLHCSRCDISDTLLRGKMKKTSHCHTLQYFIAESSCG